MNRERSGAGQHQVDVGAAVAAHRGEGVGRENGNVDELHDGERFHHHTAEGVGGRDGIVPGRKSAHVGSRRAVAPGVGHRSVGGDRRNGYRPGSRSTVGLGDVGQESEVAASALVDDRGTLRGAAVGIGHHDAVVPGGEVGKGVLGGAGYVRSVEVDDVRFGTAGEGEAHLSVGGAHVGFGHRFAGKNKRVWFGQGVGGFGLAAVGVGNGNAVVTRR